MSDNTRNNLDKKLVKEAAANKEDNDRYAADPELHGHSRFTMRAREIALALAAVVIGSLGTVSIMLPNGLTFGGITGIARIIQNYTGFNYSLTYYALSLIITAIVWVFLGFKEVRKILLMSLTYPLAMLVLELNDVVLVKSDDLFLVSVFCGVVLGVSNGLTFKAGFSSGGTGYGRQARTNSGEMNANVTIDLYTALLGGEVMLSLSNGQKVKMKIKPETQPGTKVRLRGKGYDRGDGTFGDLIITYQVTLPTNLTERQKCSIRCVRADLVEYHRDEVSDDR